MEEKKMSFAGRCKSFFGYREGYENLKDFGAELKALTPEDKMEFYAHFNAMGLPTDEPKTA